MRIYIASEIVGATTLVYKRDSDMGGRETPYPRTLRIATDEINAIINGAFRAGATYCLVNECPGSGSFIDPYDLHPGAELLSGPFKPLSIVDGLDESYDAVICPAAHARAGVLNGYCSETYSNEIYDLRLNGKPLGEMGVIGMVAGAMDIPVIFVSGDQAACEEARATFGPEVRAVTTKYGRGRYACILRDPRQTLKEITDAVEDAVRNVDNIPPLRFQNPYTLEIDTWNSYSAQWAANINGVELVDGRRIRFVSDDMWAVYRTFLAAIWMMMTMQSAANW
jgi:D-amino peptidase